jgi:hypothetical protein
MIRAWALPAVVAAAITLLTGARQAHDSPASSGRPAEGAFAIVELFTSEGCSSCPPAERQLAEIERDARRTGEPVYVLEHHVDYWDGLGWRDPFGSRAASGRQRDYASLLSGDDGVYTPQMIVQGTNAFVGSNRARARQAIDQALARPGRARVSIELVADTPTGASAGATVVRWRVEGAPEKSELHVALIESGLVSRVTAGENRGRKLEHAGVVRAFETRPLPAGSDRGTVTLPAPASPSPHGVRRVVAFVQNRASAAIVGATSADLPP